MAKRPVSWARQEHMLDMTDRAYWKRWLKRHQEFNKACRTGVCDNCKDVPVKIASL